MNVEQAISIARSTERAGQHGEEQTALQVLADEVIDLRLVVEDLNYNLFALRELLPEE